MTAETDPQVTFYDHLMPLATAAVYRIRTEQLVTENGADITTKDPLPVVEQEYEIRAVRFFLDDSSVHACYPPDGASGDFSTTLPHITLSRSILPWERQLLDSTNVAARPPWLALLVFGAGELPEDPAGRGVTATRTGRELCAPTESGVLGPALHLTAEVEATRCQTVDVPAALFTAVVPRETELLYLAHVRDVRPQRIRRDDAETLTEGQYATLAANRFPRTPGAYAVHLVSLEGFIGRLGPGQLPAGTNAVRLCALRSWSFTSDPAAELDAAGLLRRMAAAGRTDREQLALRLPPATSGSAQPDDAEKHARERLRLGYVPVTYRVLSGELTYGWYRGPLTPVAAHAVPPEPGPHTTADHRLIYDAERGVFDVSYAAAWTLGRTLALSDPDYGAAVTQVRREVANLAAGLMALGADPDRAHLDPDSATGNALRSLAAEGFGRSLRHALRGPLVTDAVAPTRRSRPRREDTRAMLDADRGRASLRAAVARRAQIMPDWLDKLALLNLVPYRYLVPHPGMLPPESLRLFRVDRGWIDALLAGAQDVGVHTSLDAQADTAVRQAVAGVRAAAVPAAGILVYSQLVRVWPVFDLIATRNGDEVHELRRDRLAPDLLLCLLDEVPDMIAIREPGQGIHFGVDSGGGDRAVISLRNLTPGEHLGCSLDRDFPAQGSLFPRYLRVVADGTPDVLRLREDGGLVTDLAAEFGLGDLTPGQFALQLVNAPAEQRLVVNPGS